MLVAPSIPEGKRREAYVILAIISVFMIGATWYFLDHHTK